MSDPNVFLLSDAKLHDERGRSLRIDLPDISAAARQAGRFVTFSVQVRPDQADPACRSRKENFRGCIQLPITPGVGIHPRITSPIILSLIHISEPTRPY